MRLVAYIDLPSGSAIFQFLIAGLLGISVAFRSFWRRVWAFITGRRKERSLPKPEGPASEPSSGDPMRERAGTARRRD
jgi:hypothetical protein